MNGIARTLDAPLDGQLAVQALERKVQIELLHSFSVVWNKQ